MLLGPLCVLEVDQVRHVDLRDRVPSFSPREKQLTVRLRRLRTLPRNRELQLATRASADLESVSCKNFKEILDDEFGVGFSANGAKSRLDNETEDRTRC